MFYVLDENHNLVEAYDKEGVLAVLEQAIEDGNLASIAADSAFVDKLKCSVGGGTFKVAFITQATYNELTANNQLINNCYYFITDDTTCESIDQQLAAINEALDSYSNRLEALEEKNVINFSTGGTNGVNLQLDWDSTYVFCINKITFVLNIPAKNTLEWNVTAATFKSNAALNSNGASLWDLQYYKNVDDSASAENILKVYYLNVAAGGSYAVLSTALNGYYYKLK